MPGVKKSNTESSEEQKMNPKTTKGNEKLPEKSTQTNRKL